MGIASTLSNEVQAWGVLAIVITIVSVILLKFRNSVDYASLNLTITTIVDALAEPKNWVAIVIIALIGFALLKLFRGKK